MMSEMGYYANYQVSLVYPRPHMVLTLNIPDDIFEDVKDKLATQPTGVLETIAMDAVLDFLDTLRKHDPSKRTVQ